MDILTNFFTQLTANIRIQDIVDILVITFVVYKIFDFLKQTRAEQLLKGIAILLVLTKISEWLQLYTVNWILSNAMTVGTIAILVVFQPELRRGLEYLGRSSIFSGNLIEIQENEAKHTVKSILDAVASLARQRIGAIIVIERRTGLNEIIDTGTPMDSLVSAELLINIFIPNTPLHDGAVIIQDDRIRAAACFLPLSENMSISKEMGTRHRAALGMSERSDSLSIVVSEETGVISIAEHAAISRHLDIDTLENILLDIYTGDDRKPSLGNFWRRINEDKGNIEEE